MDFTKFHRRDEGGGRSVGGEEGRAGWLVGVEENRVGRGKGRGSNIFSPLPQLIFFSNVGSRRPPFKNYVCVHITYIYLI